MGVGLVATLVALGVAAPGSAPPADSPVGVSLAVDRDDSATSNDSAAADDSAVAATDPCLRGAIATPCISAEVPLPRLGFAPTFITDHETVYLGLGRGNVLAVDLEEHDVRWRRRLGAALTMPVGAVGDVVTVLARGRGLVGLDRGDGEILWEQASLDRGDRIVGAAAVPGALIATTADLVAGVEPATGRVLWRHELGSAAAVRVTAAGPVVHEATSISLLDATTGRERWHLDVGAPPRTVAGTATKLAIGVDPDLVHVIDVASGSTQEVLAGRGAAPEVHVLGDALIVAVAGTTRSMLHAFPAGRSTWRSELPLGPAPASDGARSGSLLVLPAADPDAGPDVTALSAATGRVHWRAAIPAPPTGIVATGDDILVQAGSAGLLALDPVDGQVRWQLPGTMSVIATDPLVALTRGDEVQLRWIEPPL